MEHFDVLIVGAGLSGIGAAYHLQERCPYKSYAILEGRDDLGGTWSLFRYPGVRSDSDMHTLGYSFKPWTGDNAVADGDAILAYVRETAEEFGITSKIHFGTRVESASFSTGEARWLVRTTREGEPVEYSCNFLFVCAGYYDYEQGYTPGFEGMDDFEGRIVHPQKWTDDIDYAGKRVIVIGSGATAMTLVPVLAKKAAHVTMLQRSPTYVFAWPRKDVVANWLRARLEPMTAYRVTRFKNVMMGMAMYGLSRRFPKKARSFFVGRVQDALGSDFDVKTNWSPRYDPWDERLCLVADGDLFDAMKAGSVDVVTEHIARFTKTGIELKSGQKLDADLVVTATGLRLKFLGGMKLDVDGVVPDAASSMAYRGSMFSDVPNLAMSIGYINASWTLKCDLIAEYGCRLINHMDAHGYKTCTPRLDDPDMPREPLLDLRAGYVQRSMKDFPKGGTRVPWKLHQNYIRDILTMRRRPVDDGVMQFR